MGGGHAPHKEKNETANPGHLNFFLTPHWPKFRQTFLSTKLFTLRASRRGPNRSKGIGMEPNGMERNGMEWSGTLCNGMEQKGIEWNEMAEMASPQLSTGDPKCGTHRSFKKQAKSRSRAFQNLFWSIPKFQNRAQTPPKSSPEAPNSRPVASKTPFLKDTWFKKAQKEHRS